MPTELTWPAVLTELLAGGDLSISEAEWTMSQVMSGQERAAPHVAGLSALRSRVLTVIDARRSLDLGETECLGGIREAVVVELDGHHYALIVDQVEDVVESLGEPTAIRGAMEAGWSRVARGMVETEMGPILLVDVAALVSGPDQSRVAA